MSESTITRLRPRGQVGYTDTSALNDIHALLTTASDGDQHLLADVAAVLVRTGRPLVRGRDIEARITDSRIGWPVAHVDSEDATVTVRQDPAGSGLLIEITTTGPAERDQLIVILDGRCLHHACPTSGHTA